MDFGLQGIRVIETATVFAGPMAGRLLADWGADVIHVEHPIRGDIARGIQASAVGMAGVRSGRIIESDIKYEAENHNRNKKSITVDLSQDRGREIIYRLLGKADVLLSNFRPRELKKFKLEYETLKEINQRLICAHVTGYGRMGPDKDAPGYDFLTFWARSGLLHVSLKPGMIPFITPLAVGDRMTALALACGIMTALFMRERTGIGQEVDVSLFNTGIFGIAGDIGGALVTGQDLQQVDRKDILNAVTTFYQTKDGRWLRLGMTQADLYWSRFCRAIGKKDLEGDSRFCSFEPRIKNHTELFSVLEELFLTRTLNEWKACLDEAGVPWAPVQSLPEVINDPQAGANDFFVHYDHPNYGRIKLVANPIKLSKLPEMIRMPAPEFSQHTEEVLLEYGYTWEDIARFKEQGVIA